MEPQKLSRLIQIAAPKEVEDFEETVIESIAIHPSQIKPRCLFGCLDEFLEYNRWFNARSFRENLTDESIVAVVSPERIPGLNKPQLIGPNPAEMIGRISRTLYGEPDKHLDIIGVTGTNGKTTTTRLMSHVLFSLGISTGCLGTLGLTHDGEFLEEGSYTTPLSPDLYRNLAQLVSRGARAACLEISSHAIALNRIAGLTFDAAILTNLTRDHLDFHGTEKAYAEAKLQLFEKTGKEGCGVINLRSREASSFLKRCHAPVITYSLEEGADVVAHKIQLSPEKTTFELKCGKGNYPVTTKLVGRFQVENILAVLAYALHRELPICQVIDAIADFSPVPGRMERHVLPNGAYAIIDYAHNPDGLKNLLENCRALNPGAVHVVFGCGGDRDRGKRPLMGKIAAEMADHLWITSDNPRTEDPNQIIEDIREGIPGGVPRQIIQDRTEAINSAYKASKPNDLIVIAGKGHENYQLIGYTKHDYSDAAVVEDLSEG